MAWKTGIQPLWLALVTAVVLLLACTGVQGQGEKETDTSVQPTSIRTGLVSATPAESVSTTAPPAALTEAQISD